MRSELNDMMPLPPLGNLIWKVSYHSPEAYDHIHSYGYRIDLVDVKSEESVVGSNYLYEGIDFEGNEPDNEAVVDSAHELLRRFSEMFKPASAPPEYLEGLYTGSPNPWVPSRTSTNSLPNKKQGKHPWWRR